MKIWHPIEVQNMPFGKILETLNALELLNATAGTSGGRTASEHTNTEGKLSAGESPAEVAICGVETLPGELSGFYSDYGHVQRFVVETSYGVYHPRGWVLISSHATSNEALGEQPPRSATAERHNDGDETISERQRVVEELDSQRERFLHREDHDL